ncbi:hypothetical protein NL676_034895 [Syzygium grande]|nr:hypothetical protein NL676_034895 [Syzygium grande]
MDEANEAMNGIELDGRNIILEKAPPQDMEVELEVEVESALSVASLGVLQGSVLGQAHGNPHPMRQRSGSCVDAGSNCSGGETWTVKGWGGEERERRLTIWDFFCVSK